MNNVKILKPDKDGVLRQVHTVGVPAYHATGANTWDLSRKKSNYSRTVKARRYK